LSSEIRPGPAGWTVEHIGRGQPVIFVCDPGAGAAGTWRAQLPLAERWRLVFADWPAEPGPAAEGSAGLQRDAQALAELLGQGAHLVGHSLGGLAALLAAAWRPSAVWSLTVVEAPACSAARGEPAVAALEQALEALAADVPAAPADLQRAWRLALAPGSKPAPPGPASPALAARLAGGPWRALIPTDALMAATGPKLFVTGGHSPALEAIADELALLLGGQRRSLPGAGHEPQALGAPFNDLLEALMRAQPLP
jgi:pimeloyl-ACP methyl ester carboxylesterase